MRALPAHPYMGSILASHVGWVNHGRFSSLLRGFSSSFPGFKKATFQNSRQEEPSSGMSIAKFLFPYSHFIIHSHSHLSCFYSHNPEQRKLIWSSSLSHLSPCEFSFSEKTRLAKISILSLNSSRGARFQFKQTFELKGLYNETRPVKSLNHSARSDL